VILIEPYYYTDHAKYVTVGVYSEARELRMVELVDNTTCLFELTE
jgi:hypothetical protein